MWLHQATEVNALMRQFNNAIQLIKHSCQIQLKIQSSIINCHTTNTVYVVHQTTKLIELTLQVQSSIQLRHSPHSYPQS